MSEVDYRDCLDLAGEIARHVEFYDSDDLVGHIVHVIKPTIGRIQQLEASNVALIAACQAAQAEIARRRYVAGCVDDSPSEEWRRLRHLESQLGEALAKAKEQP